MPLSASVLAELQIELEDLRRQRARLSDRIDAIEKILQIDRKPEAASFLEIPKESDLPMVGLGGLPGNAQLWAAPTVKSVVLEALKEHPGVKAAAITKLLRARNYKTNGPTRLSHRVYNELWRMAKDGEITKTPDGRFFPPREGAA